MAKVQRRLTGDWTSASLDADRYFSSSSAWRGFISYRSPWNSTRLVVVALASNDDQLARLKTDLESPRINAGIRGDTAVITSDNGVRSFQVSTPFPSGQMPWYMMAVWYASQHSGFLAVLGLIATSIMGLALTAMFKRHARKRLGSGITNEKKDNNNDEDLPSAYHVLPHRRVDSRCLGRRAGGEGTTRRYRRCSLRPTTGMRNLMTSWRWSPCRRCSRWMPTTPRRCI